MDLGLAFQVLDDLLDVSASTQVLGKTAGKDAQAEKPTFVKLLALTRPKRWPIACTSQHCPYSGS